MATGIFDAQRASISLGKELGRGGEGAVYDIQGRANEVAKIYLKPPGSDHAMKLKVMAEMASPGILRLAAWPTNTLHNSSGSIIGFAMPKVSGHTPVFKLYGPKLRLQEFPRADWRFLIHAAANAARAFAAVHASGLVIGDVNHGNLVVGQDATVRLIDCDSFQVSKGSRTWHCEVGVGTHQPPEMQGKVSYAGIHRTANHDNFGLAVIIFQLLCMARHPFMGRYLGSGEPPSIEEAIAQSRYAYSQEQQRTGMAAPPGSLPVDALTPEIQRLFEAAFAPSAISGGRPSGEQWVQGLSQLASSLRECSSNQGHRYLARLPHCPWCQIEAASGTPLFPVSFVTVPGAGTGIAALWQEVTQVAEPTPLRPLQDLPTATPSAAVLAAWQQSRRLRLSAYTTLPVAVTLATAAAPSDFRFGVIAGFTTLAGLLMKGASRTSPEKRQLKAIKQDWDALRSEWKSALLDTKCPPIRRELEEIKRKHDDLATHRAERLRYLSEHARQKQFEAYLDGFPIASARISGIGRAKVTTLSSHGIDTAGDIEFNRIARLPGFGPATTNKLVAWRKMLEGQFRFDPRQGVPQPVLAVLERDIAVRRQSLESEMRNGLARLRAVTSSVAATRRSLESKAAELAPRYAQTIADAKMMPAPLSLYKRLLSLSILAICLIPVLLLVGHKEPAKADTPLPSIARPPISTAGGDHPVGPPQVTHPVTVPSPPPSTTAITDNVAAPAGNADHPETTTARPRVVLRQTAYVRSGPDNTAPVARTVPQASMVTVYERRAGWILVGDTAPWGWVYSGFLDVPP